MSDLYNEFPSWGETGDYPQDGFFYEGGDQVNEKHMDALWNGVQKHIDNLNTAIRDRVRDLHGNVVLDQGLVASIGGGTREVDVTASNDGAYVSGQYTGAVSAQTTSHTANSGSSTRTDVVYLGQDGNVSKSEGTASAPADTLKIAEVDVATDDSINDVRNYARDHANVIASENQPTDAEPGDLWQDNTANREKVYQSGAWRKLLTDQDSASITAGDGLEGGGSFDLDGGSTTLNVDSTAIAGDGLKASGGNLLIEPADFAGNGLQDDGNDNLELTQVYTDEKAQDAVGNILSDDFIYDDSGNSIDLTFSPYSELIQSISTTGTSIQFNISNDSYDEYRLVGRIELGSIGTTSSGASLTINDDTTDSYSTVDTGGGSFSGTSISLGTASDNGTCFAGGVSIFTMSDRVSFSGPVSADFLGSGVSAGQYDNFSGTLSTIEIFTGETNTSFDVSLYGVNRE